MLKTKVKGFVSGERQCRPIFTNKNQNILCNIRLHSAERRGERTIMAAMVRALIILLCFTQFAAWSLIESSVDLKLVKRGDVALIKDKVETRRCDGFSCIADEVRRV